MSILYGLLTFSSKIIHQDLTLAGYQQNSTHSHSLILVPEDPKMSSGVGLAGPFWLTGRQGLQPISQEQNTVIGSGTRSGDARITECA